MKQKMFEYELQHTGKPYANRIPNNAWRKLSRHHTIKAALNRIKKETKHWQALTGDDHYRIIRLSDGKILDAAYARLLFRNNFSEAEVNADPKVWYTISQEN